MLKIKKKTIMLTKGDSLRLKINIFDADGTQYIPDEGDEIRFALKKDYNDYTAPLIYRDIPYDTLVLQLYPEDTKELDVGDYKYDIQITMTDGTVDTFIDRADFILTEEVE